MGLISLGAGVAIGYVIGTKNGKAKLEKGIESVKRTADETWNDPKVQDFVHKASDSAAKVAHEATTGAKRTASAAADAWRSANNDDEHDGHESSDHDPDDADVLEEATEPRSSSS